MFKKMYGFVLSIFLLMCSSLSYADGLFDFQMKLANKGNAEAEFKIGEMYETGFGVKKDQKQAEIWTKKAAAQGHETAGFKLLFWDIRKNGLKGDNKKKFAELRTKAADGNAQAMYYVGRMYAHGVGVKKNYDKALDWLNKATFIGVLEAEREAILVRERKQQSLAKSRSDEGKRKAKVKAEEEKIKAEADRKAAEEKRAKAEADKKNQDANKQSAKKKELEVQGNKAAEAARLEEAMKKQAEADAEAKAGRKRLAELKKKKAEQQKKKESKFESDPCKGKSARFLSTCR